MISREEGENAIKTGEFVENKGECDETCASGEGHGVEEFLQLSLGIQSLL